MTVIKHTPPPWLFEDYEEVYQDRLGNPKVRKLRRMKQITSDAEYRKAMNDYFKAQYAGLGPPVKGTEIFEIQPPEWALENLIQDGGLTMIHGAPGSGKSLLALDWAYVLAHPQLDSWAGQKRRRQYKPFYLYTEGVPGLVSRSKAWQVREDLDMPDEITFQFTPLALNRRDDPDKPWSEQVSALRRQFDETGSDLLIIDTLANTFAGNENSQQDANNYMAALRMFQEGGVPVVVIHHDKRGANEYRGSSVLHGAFDTMVHTEKSGSLIRLSLTKQKDGDDRFGMDLRLSLFSWDEDRSSVALTQELNPPGFSQEQEETLGVLGPEGFTLSEIAKMLDLPESTTDKRLRSLEAKDLLVKRGTGKKGDPYRYALADNDVEEL